MRLSSLFRLFILVLLLGGTLALPAFDPPGSVAVADDEDDDGYGTGDDDGEDDGNEGRGNDDKDDKQKKDDDGDDDDEVSAAAAYQVDVTCDAGDATGETTCTFVPLAPEDGKAISHLVVPEAVACAEVIGGNGEFVDPDPNAHVSGYRFTGNGPYTLVLAGGVRTDGATTYWVKAANYVYPATGPGLACDVAATLDETTPPAGKSTPEPTEPAAATTGTVVVEAFACASVPADTTDFDWYGACTPDTTAHRYLLAAVGDTTAALLAASTADTAAATFGDLAPGVYNLDDDDARWCHAESDRVNTDGNVVVEAGATTTVWLFYCHEGGS